MVSRQNYFPQKPAKLSLAPSKIDKLIMAKKIAIGELERISRVVRV